MDYIKRMRDLREDNDKTQQEIAEILNTSQTMYARYERGADELPIHRQGKGSQKPCFFLLRLAHKSFTQSNKNG